jgi:hypothetical protein
MTPSKRRKRMVRVLRMRPVQRRDFDGVAVSVMVCIGFSLGRK